MNEKLLRKPSNETVKLRDKLKVEVYKSNKKSLAGFMTWVWQKPKALQVLFKMSSVIKYVFITGLFILGLYLQSGLLIVIFGFLSFITYYKLIKQMWAKQQFKKKYGYYKEHDIWGDTNLITFYSDYIKNKKKKARKKK